MLKGIGIDALNEDDTALMVDWAHIRYSQKAHTQLVRITFKLGKRNYDGWTDGVLSLYQSLIKMWNVRGILVLASISDEVVLPSRALYSRESSYTKEYLAALERILTLKGISYWEVLPAPNMLNIDPYVAAHVMDRAIVLIWSKRNQPSIISGGIRGVDEYSGGDFLARMLSSMEHAKGLSYFGLQPYFSPKGDLPPHTILSWLHEQNSHLAEHAIQMRPFFITECGWNTAFIDEEVQARNLSHLYWIAAYYGIAACVWSRILDNPFIDTHRDGLLSAREWKKSAYTAYQLAR